MFVQFKSIEILLRCSRGGLILIRVPVVIEKPCGWLLLLGFQHFLDLVNGAIGLLLLVGIIGIWHRIHRSHVQRIVVVNRSREPILLSLVNGVDQRARRHARLRWSRVEWSDTNHVGVLLIYLNWTVVAWNELLVFKIFWLESLRVVMGDASLRIVLLLGSLVLSNDVILSIIEPNSFRLFKDLLLLPKKRSQLIL